MDQKAKEKLKETIDNCKENESLLLITKILSRLLVQLEILFRVSCLQNCKMTAYQKLLIF